MKILRKLAFDQMPEEEGTGDSLSTYRRLRRYVVLTTSLAVLAPLIIVTVVNYTQDQRAYRTESRFEVSRILSNTKSNLEFVIEERRSVLSMIINGRSHKELSSDEGLDAILRNLRGSFGGFVDLGLIDADGTQAYYAGPYDLRGRNYSDQAWFHEVWLRGIYVSDVFMGHRNFPHFVIAVKHEDPGGKSYVLRTTIDTELLDRQIYNLGLARHMDAFITNREGILQTASAFYGDVLSTVDKKVPPHSRNREVIEEYEEGGSLVTFGYAYIERSPFILMVLTQQESPLAHWLTRRSQFVWFVVASILLILVVVFYNSTHMVNRLRLADQRRAKILHNIEYTNKMATIGRLAAGVAHEINNPLAIINEKAGLLKDMATYTPDFPKADKVLNLVDSISNSVERCSRVTRRLLGFGKRMDIHKEDIDLEHLLKEVVGFQTTEAAHRNVEISHHVANSVPTIQSDRGQLQQIFLNLLNNAFAAVEDGGTIDISVDSPNSNEVAVTIADNGSGISKDNLKHIFEPFYSTKGAAGTGLGLSITRDLVEKLGGLIEVESELGKGTTFIVNLPVEKVV